MRQTSPLHQFGAGHATPYVRNWRDGTRNYVFPVKPRVEYGLALMLGTRVHRIKDAAGSFYGGHMHFGARWLCNTYSPDIAFVATPDIAPMCGKCERARIPSVYRCFAAAEHLLYVGHSSNVPVRTSRHAVTAPWWPEVVAVRTEEFATVLDALAAEERAIRDECPAYNVKNRVRT